MTGGYVATMDDDARVFTDGLVAIDGSHIVAVGDRRTLEQEYDGARTIDAAGKAVIPGLINGHTHAFQTLYRGLGDDMLVLDWVKRVIYPLTRHLGAEGAFVGTQLACLEMIKGGVSCFTDSFYAHLDPDAIYQVARAVEGSGLRAVIARACSDTGDRPPEFIESTKAAIETTEDVMRRWSATESDRVRICPEALYTLFSTPELIAGLRDLADRHGTTFHMHAGEAMEEATQIRRETGSTIVSYLRSLDALGSNVLLFHLVWCNMADIDLLAETETAVAHNPVSNGYLASGIAPISAMVRRGVTVALGSDGAASNNSQDMFEVMKTAVLLQKASLLDPRALSAVEALHMATRNGAAGLGMADQIGSIEPDRKADIAIVDLQTPHSTPALRPVSNLVYCARAADVATLIVDGRVIMEDRKVLTMDEDAVLEHAADVAHRLVERSGAGHLLEPPEPG